MINHDTIIDENKNLKRRIKSLETELNVLDRQLYYFKALLDLKQEIAPFSNIRDISRAFLMIIVGTIGVFQAFIMIVNMGEKRINCLESMSLNKGFLKLIIDFFQNRQWNIFLKEKPLCFFNKTINDRILSLSNSDRETFDFLVSNNICTFVPFKINEKYYGALGLDKRITGDPLSKIDKDIIFTLLEQLVTNILNVSSFEMINELNMNLAVRDRTLEETYKKIQLLEKSKTLLFKFIPRSLEKLIEAKPESPDLNKKDIDISVLFLDIEGYTTISEKLEYEEITQVIETYFSFFIDDIFQYNGDINMNLGDGLMIIFQDENQNKHALNAVEAAIAIKEKTKIINEKMKGFIEPFSLNIGIHSGVACVGTNRLDGYFGSRWTYTAIGPTVNISARISSFAKKGEILVSNSTMSRVKDKFSFEYLGPQQFKNLGKEILIYRIIHPVFS